jgi:hypothetical protein
MNRMVAVTLLAFSASMFAQTPQLHSGSTVYIEPMDGYETYLAAALTNKHVPLIVVTDKTKADFIVTSTVSQHRQNDPAVIINNSNNSAPASGFPGPNDAKMRAFGETDVSVAVIDVKSSQIVFATSTEQRGAADQKTRTAERCAARLNEFIKKSEKPKK